MKNPREPELKGNQNGSETKTERNEKPERNETGAKRNRSETKPKRNETGAKSNTKNRGSNRTDLRVRIPMPPPHTPTHLSLYLYVMTHDPACAPGCFSLQIPVFCFDFLSLPRPNTEKNIMPP